jgi:filamentous hemagglutinin family protein
MGGRFTIFAALNALALMVSILIAAPPTSIVPNGFGTSVSGAGGIYNITGGFAPGGGNNLFHSFSTFNLGTGDTADFDVTSNVTNIIARVTGGASTIDGTITSTVGPGGPVSNANLFLINPAGILFTANAALNLNGAFVASTANYAKLSDGTYFYADVSHPINDAGLTSAPVSAFGFISATPAPISFEGTQFTNAGGIHAIGGDITLDQATTLFAPGGNLTLFSAASAGEVPFSLASPGSGFANATTTSFGNLTMQNGSKAAIDSAQGGGSIVIRGGQIMIENYSAVGAADSGPNPGGTISVQAVSLSLQNAGQITTTTSGAGDAGEIEVKADSMTINGTAETIYLGSLYGTTGIGTFADDNAGASPTGDSGAIDVQVTHELSIMNAGQITTVTDDSTGNAGEITVHAGKLSIMGTLDAAENGEEPGIISETLTNDFQYPSGNSGAIDVTVDGLATFKAGGEIASGTFSNGNGGNITFTAQNLVMDGSATPGAITGIVSDTEFVGSGNAGAINVKAGNISMVNNSLITASTDGSNGAGGSVSVTASSLTIDASTCKDRDLDTGIFSQANGDPNDDGYAGPVTVSVSGPLAILGGGAISSQTLGYGDGGNVTVHAGSLEINGAVDPQGTGIFASAGMNDGTVTGNGVAGNIAVKVGGNVSLLNGASIDTSSDTDGGNVSLKVVDLLFLLNSQITTFSFGNGGDISIDPQFVVLDGGAIDAAAFGIGGNISITTSNFLDFNSSVFATGGVSNGSISISAPDLNLSGSLLPLPNALVSDENELKESCLRSMGHEYSSLIVVGRGGTEAAPDELQPDFGVHYHSLPIIR